MPADAREWWREPGGGRYARPERERRFLLTAPVPAGEAARLIEDRYLEGTCLRLRRVSHLGRSIHKLTQKVRTDERDPSEVHLTNMYLSESEYLRLATLPGSVLVKTRTVLATSRHQFVVDEFADRLEGLRLAEVEVRDLSEPLALPTWLGTEVTHDDRFSGGRLASMHPAQLRELLREQ